MAGNTPPLGRRTARHSARREDTGWMNLFRVWACALVLTGFGMGAGVAAALDAPRPLHHTKTTDSHLTEPHRAAGHHATSHAPPHAATLAARRSTRAQDRKIPS